MTPVSVLAASAVSALGRGARAYGVGDVADAPPRGLSSHAGTPERSARLVGSIDDQALPRSHADRAERLVFAAARDLAAALDQRLPDWRSSKIRCFVGTSAGAMQSMCEAFALRAAGRGLTRELARRANYGSALDALYAGLALERVEVVTLQVLAACASATIALGCACRSLEAGECELAIAGGYDALHGFVAAGFEALGALSKAAPQPFRTARDGMALGEGAGFVALRLSGRSTNSAAPELGRILGFGASADAVHVTAPDREGRGLARAASRALSDAGVEPHEVGWVSAHATATPYNDAAETKALQRLFGERIPPLHAWKANIGHTLGAAGVLEALAVWDALGRRVLPGVLGDGAAEAAVSDKLANHNQASTARTVLKLSAAFGGCNAALVLGSAGSAGRAPAVRPRAVGVLAIGDAVSHADAALVLRVSPAAARAAERADSLSELVLSAVARLLEARQLSLPELCAVIVATDVATLELNDAFDQRRRTGEAVEPRRFPATSPSLAAGLCSIVFGLQGPAFSVGGGPGAAVRALELASRLVRDADAPAALVVAAEDVGPVTRDLYAAAEFELPARMARAALVVPVDGNAGVSPLTSAADLAELWRSLRENSTGR